VSRGSTIGKRVALTFDAGSDDASAAAIVATLHANNVPGSFFVTGRFAESYPSSLRTLATAGSVYNHSYSHPSFTGVSSPDHLSTAQMLDQIERAEAAISAVTGHTTKPYFRPPYGDQNAAVNQVLGQAGFRYDVLWTIDSKGWKGVAPDQVVQNVLTQAVPGAIVAMHVGTGATDAAALQRVIDGLRAQGYTPVPLSALI
jgi:peptidoglycan/xylan/chitin deacetylase (PgdA/CDA1 family)